ncbi:MAG: helix-turn-helix transcriptional regulator [Candidatus Kapabacteria bacterium]|nr:helix-turn-helix transcriptional regulator [Ignavibacteriota bacterium]MCW5884184.1 helix-turn-helix transcriptional regulator [Candidatus Kapabacteria bacterium]
MSTYAEQVGERLKKIRFIFNEGGKLSADQFAFLLGETRDKIANYELGRAGLPIRVLLELYRRGISPIYLISGEGSIFSDNNEGKNFKHRISEKVKSGWKFSQQSMDILYTALGSEVDFSNVKLAAGKVEKK